MRVWEYVVGKPKEKIEVSADVTMQERLAEERKLDEQLSVPQLEELLKESEAPVEKARAMASGTYTPNGATEMK